MKKLLFIAVVLLGISSYSQDQTTFILVRHAEKANDGTKNPLLSEAGVQRANDLLDLLSMVEVTAIYSTGYDRTMMTVAPLAAEKDLNIQEYNWGDPKALAQQMLDKNKGGTVIVSGHSNTTPFLANGLLGEEKFQQFDDSDYGNLLIITVTELGNGKLTHLRF